ncbi:MAG TPA: asparagine synthase (glutamine-hydrolyzing) [Thermoanaerobaculia bacterium]|nr:asparagine synthase (glutamine-hydrolyzing) [Thermoanaerobaculia bacterium]
MCGIAGILSLDGRPVVAEDVQNMCDAIVHRGPDDQGLFVRPDVGLGMRRLSIIDLQTGQQPISNEDGSVWVVFNGEIYNFQALRNDLIGRGHRLATRTDTEVIVHLYEEYGASVVDHLRGMFAFALWDARRKRLLLGRDRLGIKPLYYADFGDRLVFASELKAILQLPGVERELDWVAVNHLLTNLTTPSSQSIIRGIRKLEPAHVLLAGPDAPTRVLRYWDVVFEPNRRATEDDLIEELRETIDESVGMHMISDVPVGAFLSGGIDSSSVVAHMAQQAGRRPVKTFAIGFNEASFNELPYARTIARRFGTDHHELVLEPDITGIVDDLVWHLDEPFGDPSAIPTFMVSRMAAEQVKVVLSGDGGDELFAGYDKYSVEQRERRYSRLPLFVRRTLGAVGSRMGESARGRNFLLHHSLSGWERYIDAAAFFRERARRELLHPDVFAPLQNDDPLRGAHWLSAAQYLDLHRYLPDDILTKVDRMSMAHSLEVRVPLLDHKVVEFAATIPPELNLNGDGGKCLFKKAMRGILPDEVIDRPKRGFAVPLASWFRGELEGFARELLLSRRCRERNIFNHAYVERVLDLHRGGRPLDFQLWTLISFEMWCRTFVDTRTQPRFAVAAGASA